MVEENLEEKIEKLKGLKKEAEAIAAKAAEESEKRAAREREILASVKKLESSLPPISGSVKDAVPFFTDNRTYLNVEWFLYYDENIHTLYMETPSEKAKAMGTKYTPKREKKRISDWSLDLQELAFKRLPEFAEVLFQKARK